MTNDSAPQPVDQLTQWNEVCSLAELSRILTILHGAKAPSDGSLKKWSAGGEFRDCVAPADAGPGTSRHDASRPGRPGLRLYTKKAMDRVYEMWPFLSENSAQSVLDLALDRTTEHLKQAIDTIVSKQVSAQPVEAANPPQAPATGGAALADTPALDTRMSEWQRQINDKMEAMAASIAAVQREMAQFSKFSSNLVLRLDDAVAKTRESLASAHAHGGPAHDPLVEARRDRDMGIIKSSLESIHQALERAGISTV